MLSIPEYLKAAGVKSSVIRYAWDDWRTLPDTETPDEMVLERLNKVSLRAVLAFGTATAEWIVYRFEGLSDRWQRAWSYFDAAWAMIVEPRYSGYGSAIGWQQFVRDEWEGPVDGVIKETLSTLEVAFQQVAWKQGSDPRVIVATLPSLAKHVLPRPDAYHNWMEQVMTRLERLYPLDNNDVLGEVVPRQAVDTERDFNVADTERLINEFLASLDYRGNPFLSPPEGVLESEPDLLPEFRGHPYTFDVNIDREMRGATRL